VYRGAVVVSRGILIIGEVKIAIAIENFDPRAGGRERSTLQIARQLLGRGHGVTVLANRATAAGRVALPEARFIVADGPTTKHGRGLARFAGWVGGQLDGGEHDTSLSVTMAVPAAVVQPREGCVAESFARKLAMDRSRPGGWAKALGTRLRPKLRAWMMLERRTLADARVKHICAISHYIAAQFEHHHGLSPPRLVSNPNAAEVERLNPVQREAVRATLELNEHDVAFLFASMDARRKGLGQLLRAFRTVVRQQPRAKLLVAGPAGGRAQPNVRWLGPSDRIDELYAACDVTVLPTWYDPAAKVTLESLLHGRPTISTLTNGSSQWVYSPTGGQTIPTPFDAVPPGILRSDHPQAGRVIDSAANIDALAAAMIELCDAEVRQAASAACAGLEQHITMQAHVDQLEKLLAATAGGSARRGEHEVVAVRRFARALVLGGVERVQRLQLAVKKERPGVAQGPEVVEHAVDPAVGVVAGFAFKQQRGRVRAERLLGPAEHGQLVAFDIALDEPHRAVRVLVEQGVERVAGDGDGVTRIARFFGFQRCAGRGPVTGDEQLGPARLIGQRQGERGDVVQGHRFEVAFELVGQGGLGLDAEHPAGRADRLGHPVGVRPFVRADVDGGVAGLQGVEHEADLRRVVTIAVAIRAVEQAILLIKRRGHGRQPSTKRSTPRRRGKKI